MMRTSGRPMFWLIECSLSSLPGNERDYFFHWAFIWSSQLKSPES